MPILWPALVGPREGTACLQGSGSSLGLELRSGSVGTGGVASGKREGASPRPGPPPRPLSGLLQDPHAMTFAEGSGLQRALWCRSCETVLGVVGRDWLLTATAGWCADGPALPLPFQGPVGFPGDPGPPGEPGPAVSVLSRRAARSPVHPPALGLSGVLPSCELAVWHMHLQMASVW